jgi:hypothetical protein
LLCPRKVTCWASFLITVSNSGTAAMARSKMVGLDFLLFISVYFKVNNTQRYNKILLLLTLLKAIRLWRI